MVARLAISHSPSWRCLLLSLSALPLLAQAPAPLFKSTSNFVEATAVVRDGQGNAIGNLTVADFELFDNGRKQVISRFEVQRLSSAQPAPSRGANSSTTPLAASPTALPNHFVAFVVDDQNLVPENFTQGTIAAIHHLSRLRPGDRAAVVSTSGSKIVPFTSDREKLRKALANVGSLDRRSTFEVAHLNSEIKCDITYLRADLLVNGDPGALHNCAPPPGVPEQFSASSERPIPGVPQGPPGEAHQIGLENQIRAFAESIVQAGDRDVQNYFNGIGQLIRTMSHMPGERTIILLSPGMYVAPRFKKIQDNIIADAVRSKVVISGVDPRGVYIRNDKDDPSTRTDTWGLAELNQRVGFMESVTSGTGGTFIQGNNDIAGVVAQLDSVPEFVYVLGFSPSELQPDNKVHILRIALQPSRGLHVYARRGYHATDPEPVRSTDLRRETEDAFFSDRQIQTLPVQLQVRSSHKPNVSIVLTAVAQIDLHDIPFHRENDLNHSDLTLGIGLFDDNGNLMNDAWKSISLHPADEQLDSLRRSGIEIKTDFDVAPGRYMVRLAVRDSQSSAIGTQTVAVNIRP